MWRGKIGLVLLASFLVSVLLAHLVHLELLSKLDDVLLIPSLLFITWEYNKNKTFIVFLILASSLIGTGLISDYLNAPLQISEVIWNIRWYKLLTVGWSVYYLSKWNVRAIEYGVFGLFMIHTGVCLFELIFPANFFIEQRVSGVFGNPNNTALCFLIIGAYFTALKDKKYIPWILVSIIMIVATQSRTALITTFICLLLVPIVYKFKITWRRGVVVLVILTLTLTAIFQFKNSRSLLNGTAFQSNSFLTRVHVIESVQEINKDNWLMGQGKIANIPERYNFSIDNEMAYWFLEYGMVGVFLYLILIVTLFYLATKMRKESLIFVVIAVVCGMTNLVVKNMELGSVFFILFVASWNKKGISSKE